MASYPMQNGRTAPPAPPPNSDLDAALIQGLIVSSRTERPSSSNIYSSAAVAAHEHKAAKDAAGASSDSRRINSVATNVSSEAGRGDAASNRAVSMTEQDLESVAVIYGGLKSLRGPGISAEEDARVTEAFDKHIQQTMLRLSTRLEGITDIYQRQIEIALAKSGLYDVCYRQAAEVAARWSPQLSSLLTSLHAASSPLLNQVPKLTTDLRTHYVQRANHYQSLAAQQGADTQSLFSAAKELEAQVEALQKENAALKHALHIEVPKDKASWELERLRLVKDKQSAEGKASEMAREIANLRGALETLNASPRFAPQAPTGTATGHSTPGLPSGGPFGTSAASRGSSVAHTHASAPHYAQDADDGDSVSTSASLAEKVKALMAGAGLSQLGSNAPLSALAYAPVANQTLPPAPPGLPPRSAPSTASMPPQPQSGQRSAGSSAGPTRRPSATGSYASGTGYQQQAAAAGQQLAGNASEGQPGSVKTASTAVPRPQVQDVTAGGEGAHPSRPASTQSGGGPAASNEERSQRVDALLLALGRSKQATPAGGRSASLEPRRPAALATDGVKSPKSPGSYGPSVPRALSLKQLHDTIDALFASKAQHDAKNFAQRLPRETLEQHLYTYLNQRFGLRQLIIEHAAAIINTATALAPYDNDAAVFSKILRNEIDEDFRLVQLQLKATARDLLRVQLRDAMPRASEGDITTALAGRIGAYYVGLPEVVGPHPSDATGVHETEWRQIITYMYSPQDADMLIRKIQDVIVRRTLSDAFGLTPVISGVPVAQQLGAKLAIDPPVVSLSPGGARSPGGSSPPVSSVAVDNYLASNARISTMLTSFPPAEIARILAENNPSRRVAWPSFLHVLLQFQLDGHDRFLAKFRRLFREIDIAASGLISAPQFRSLVTAVNAMKTDREIDGIVARVDPHGHGRISFSDCVAVLSADLAAQLHRPGGDTDASAAPLLSSHHHTSAAAAVTSTTITAAAPRTAPHTSTSGSAVGTAPTNTSGAGASATKRAITFATPEGGQGKAGAKAGSKASLLHNNNHKPHPLPYPLPRAASEKGAGSKGKGAPAK